MVLFSVKIVTVINFSGVILYLKFKNIQPWFLLLKICALSIFIASNLYNMVILSLLLGNLWEEKCESKLYHWLFQRQSHIIYHLIVCNVIMVSTVKAGFA